MEQSPKALFLHLCILFVLMSAQSESIKIESLVGSYQVQLHEWSDWSWDWWHAFKEWFTHTKLSMDWKETPQGHVITLDVPGMDFKFMKIEVLMDKWELHIRTERTKEGEKGQYHYYAERSYGKFLRKLKLPQNVDIKSIECNLAYGVLIVSMAKQFPDEIKSHRVTIGDNTKRTSWEEL